VIRLTRLDGTEFWLNRDQVQSVEATPDTLILLTNGRRLLVREALPEVVSAMSEPVRLLKGRGHGGAVEPTRV
jgi:flagellar protein FlbD